MTENIYSNQLFETHINNLNSVSKKTPPESSINILKQFKELIDRDNFIYYESYLVYRMLPTVLNRLNDNPLVNEFILELGLEMFSKLSIQSFPAVTNILFDQTSVTAKWKMKLGCLKLLNC